MKRINARGAGVFFAGFAAGVLFLAILLKMPGKGDSAHAAADRHSIGELETQPVEPKPSGGISLPINGLRASDILDTFSQKRGQRIHEATDIMAPRGTPVLAVANGSIRKLFTSKAGGLTVYQFDSNEVYCYYYAHLDRYAEGLREGIPMVRGQLVGYVGSTGNASPAAPHLHFAITLLGPEKRWWEGKAINPYPLLVDALNKQANARALLH
jgi:murein DD-endopeptidase MepM/ murein hydrolase activator NlpD